MKKKLFFDVDGTIYDSSKRFVEIYNEEYNQAADWRKVNKWDFSDICPLLKNHDAERYFSLPEFYNKEMDYQDVHISSIISYLYKVDGYDIHFITIGSEDNLIFKRKLLEWHFPYIPKTNYHLLEKTDMGKGEIDMTGGILIDDNYINLLTSNADLKICMHRVTEWNKDVEKSGFKRLSDGLKLYNYIKALERDGKFNG